MIRAWAVLLLTVACNAAVGGQSCEERTATPAEVGEAAQRAIEVHGTLSAADASVALVARAGTDLSKYDLKYSHIALAVRDEGQPTWTLIHLLNECGTGHSTLYDQGLINFMIDDLYTDDIMILLLKPAAQADIVKALESGHEKRIHDREYNMVAYPWSDEYQNSNQWLLEFLAVALDGSSPSRRSAQDVLKANGYEPDRIKVGRLKRLVGGLTQPNLTFLDHPLGDRLASRYKIVTVRSMRRYLEARGLVERVMEL